MKLLLLHLLLGQLVVASAHAQAPPRYSVGVGLEKMGFDGPDGLGIRYLLGIGRHWKQDRVVVTANLGYGWADNRRYLGVNNWYLDGKRRERLTLDVTAAFDLLKHPRHAFRVGVGPSMWYRREEQLEYARFTIDSQGKLLIRSVRWYPVDEVNYGFNVLVEYEFALTDRLLLRINTKFANLHPAGQSTLYGGGIAYRLR